MKYQIPDPANKEADLAYMTPMSFLLKRMAENGLNELDLDPKLDQSPINVDAEAHVIASANSH